MSIVSSLALGATAGLAAAPHCVVMCGPIAAACGVEAEGAGAYGLARILAYGALGALVGGVAAPIASLLPPPVAALVLGGVMAIALVLAARRLVAPRVTVALVPAAQLVRGRAKAAPTWAAAALGLGTGLLPCGALYAGLLLAAGAGNVLSGASVMVGFGVASGLPLLGAGAVFERVASTSIRARRAIAWVLVLGAVLVVARPLFALLHPEASCHG